MYMCMVDVSIELKICNILLQAILGAIVLMFFTTPEEQNVEIPGKSKYVFILIHVSFFLTYNIIYKLKINEIFEQNISNLKQTTFIKIKESIIIPRGMLKFDTL